MIIDSKHLLGLGVETKSGQHLGKVRGFHIDTVTHAILQYEVRRSGILKEFLATDLLVYQQQVLSITKEKMVVDDQVVSEEERAQEGTRVPATSPSTPAPVS